MRTLAVLPPQARMELLVMSVLWGGDQNLQDAYDTHEQRYGVLSSSSSPSSHQNPSAATSSRAPSPPMSRMLSSSSKSAPSSRPPAEAPPPSPTLTTKFSAKNLFLGGGKARNNSKDEPASSASTKRSNRGSYSLEVRRRERSVMFVLEMEPFLYNPFFSSVKTWLLFFVQLCFFRSPNRI